MTGAGVLCVATSVYAEGELYALKTDLSLIAYLLNVMLVKMTEDVVVTLDESLATIPLASESMVKKGTLTTTVDPIMAEMATLVANLGAFNVADISMAIVDVLEAAR